MKNIIAVEAIPVSPMVIDKTYFPIVLTPDSSIFQIKNGGTASTPCRLSLTPLNDSLVITISGLSDEDIQLKNIYAGRRVVLDGINRTIEVDGANGFSHFEGWEFPRLLPGINEITISGVHDMNLIEIEFQPRYL